MNGYSLPDPSTVDSPAELRAAFEWMVPSTYNISGECLSWTETRPDRTALYHVDEAGAEHEFSYRELSAAAKRIAGVLRANDISRGDRIALCLPPSPEALLVHLGAYRLGAVVVPVSILHGDETLAHIISNSDVTTMWLDTVAQRRFEDALEEVRTAPVNVVEVGASGYDSECRPLGGLEPKVSGARCDGVAETAPDDPAIFVSTSGSSGRPKVVVQSHQYLLGTLPGYQLWFEVFGDSHTERVWTPASWAWAGGLFDVVFPTLAMGGTVCSRVRRSGFDPEAALAFVERAGVTRAFFPPTALRKTEQGADPSNADLSTLEVMLCGGEPLPEPLREWAEDALGVRINASYGLTEANALIGHCRALYPHRENSIGIAYPGHDVKVIDADGRPLPPGETGDIVVEPPDPVLFRGYWNDGEISDEPGDEPFYTGDRGCRDEDGYLYYEGRKDAVIITSGYRVDPNEIETALQRHEEVEEAVVGGVPDEEYGQRIVAYVVPADETGGQALNETALKDRVREQLGKYKAPHEIRDLSAIPQTYSGKVDREELFSQ